jgi:hypothetical protein
MTVDVIDTEVPWKLFFWIHGDICVVMRFELDFDLKLVEIQMRLDEISELDVENRLHLPHAIVRYGTPSPDPL